MVNTCTCRRVRSSSPPMWPANRGCPRWPSIWSLASIRYPVSPSTIASPKFGYNSSLSSRPLHLPTCKICLSYLTLSLRFFIIIYYYHYFFSVLHTPLEKWILKSASEIIGPLAVAISNLQKVRSVSGPLAEVATASGPLNPLADFGIHFSGGNYKMPRAFETICHVHNNLHAHHMITYSLKGNRNHWEYENGILHARNEIRVVLFERNHSFWFEHVCILHLLCCNWLVISFRSDWKRGIFL